METKGKRGNKPWTRWIWLLALVTLLQGCATQFSIGRGIGYEDSETSSVVPVLRFQTNSIAPAAVLEPGALQPGDILLTSEPTLASATVRLITFAPVSHAAVYVGDRKVAEAVRSGVRVRDLDEMLAEAT